jgi:hypothetical protein
MHYVAEFVGADTDTPAGNPVGFCAATRSPSR